MAMFENFPYTDLHALNLDWIVKIAKDFLDQYTSIQQIITDGEQSLENRTSEGLEQLQNKADALEELLNEWYSAHSDDIANQLTQAITDLNSWYSTHQTYLDQILLNNISAFNSSAESKTAECIAQIPASYSELSQAVESLKGTFDNMSYQQANTLPFSPGRFSLSSGSLVASNIEIRLDVKIPAYITRITCPSNMEMWLYGENGTTWLGRWAEIGFTKNPDYSPVGFHEIYPKAYEAEKLYLVIRFVNESDISPVDSQYVKIYQETDRTLSILGAPADAASVREFIYNIHDYKTPLHNYVNANMSRSQFAQAFNNTLENVYAPLCKYAVSSFYKLVVSDDVEPWEDIIYKINANFRKNIVNTLMPFDVVCRIVNKAFETPVRMYNDAILNGGAARNFSRAFSFRSGEPAVVISNDLSEMYCYSSYGDTRSRTTDGITWITENLSFSTTERPEHGNVNLIQGTYYLVAKGHDDKELHLWTSTDGLNFTERGILIRKPYDFGTGDPVTIWGNSYLIRTNNRYYLYVEGYTQDTFWKIYMMYCVNILELQQGGTIGDWTNSSVNPILTDRDAFPYSQDTISIGNPDFAKGEDNRPLRVDGKYMMYFHCNRSGDINIWRASSMDLVHWTIDGKTINNRDVPTNGDNSSGNGDQAIGQFKGRTYLFYTWDINAPEQTPYIKYLIDDRPILEMMKMYP